MPSVDFRAGVVTVVRRSDGLLLAFRRAGTRDSWQLPQGGIDPGEEPVETAWRELGEETGLGPDDVALVGEHPRWLAQEWPVDLRSKGGRRLGQVHRWFTFAAHDDAVEPRPDGVEFDAWRWVTDAWMVEAVVHWRRAAYAQGLDVRG